MSGPSVIVSAGTVEVLSKPVAGVSSCQVVAEVLIGSDELPAGTAGPLIPAMTSNTAPSGTVTYSSQYYNAWWAFSQNLSYQGWLNNGSALPAWLGYQLPTAKTVTSYQMRQYSENYASGNRRIKTWTFQGSTDGGTWYDLDTQTDYVWPTDWTAKTYFGFTIASPVSYAYYRVYVTANWGDTYTGIGGLQLWDNTVVAATASQVVAEVLLEQTPSVEVSQSVVEVLATFDGSVPATGGGGTTTFGYST